MILNYALTALRALLRHKLAAAINIISLATGLAVFLLAQLYAQAETSTDAFFADADRIFGIQSNYKPGSGTGMAITPGAFSAVGPFLPDYLPGVEHWARLRGGEHVIGIGQDRYHQQMRFADPAFFEIFSFQLLAGVLPGPDAGPDAVVLTATAAKRFFGPADPIGRTLSIDNQETGKVVAVIADLPKATHFIIPWFDQRFEMIATNALRDRLYGSRPEGDWNSLSPYHNVYVKLAPGTDLAAAEDGLARLYQEAHPDAAKRFVGSYSLRPLDQMSQWIWDAAGLPVVQSIRILGSLVLLVAALNYTNLAAAQAMGRAREVGLRKTLGAARRQLLSQFLVESICLAVLALILAVMIVEWSLPLINAAAGKDIALDLLGAPARAVWLLGVAVAIGLAAGAYPAFLIQRPRAVDLLRRHADKGRTGQLIRSGLLVLQFSASILMMIGAVIIYGQNRLIERSAAVFDKDRVVVVSQIDEPAVRGQLDVLRQQFARIPGIEAVSFSSQVPFQNNIDTGAFSLTRSDTADGHTLHILDVDATFFQSYGLALLHGRIFSAPPTGDDTAADRREVVLNQLAARKLGFATPQEALGQSLYVHGSDRRHEIVGIVADVNFYGLHNDVKPFLHQLREGGFEQMSLHLSATAGPQTLAAIDAAWRALVPDLPVRRRLLSDYFRDVFVIFSGLNTALAVFAAVALLLAATGLFSMTAFAAARRSQEIAVRRVLGASVARVAQQMAWQFVRPVLIALALALPLAWLLGSLYLQFFADRITLGPGLFALTAAAVLLLAIATVSYHAVRTARTNPATVLRAD
ncbi:MAG: ABC transporter permease [Rhodothalassiaceae bacterium]